MKTIECKQKEEEHAVESTVVNFPGSFQRLQPFMPDEKLWWQKSAASWPKATRWRQDGKIRYVNTIEWVPWIHVWTCCRLWTNKCRMPRGSRWVLSRRVALSYFLFALACRKSTNPFECSIFRRGSPTTAALSPARAAGSASKAVPFLFFYCFQIFGMWCLHHLARSWCSNRIFVVFVWILCSSYSVAQQATYTVQACAGLSGRIKTVDFHCTLSQFLPAAAGSRSRLFSAYIDV